MAKSVEEYLSENKKWESALAKLRALCTEGELNEEIKWGAPCYTLNGKNVIGMAAFKSYVGLWFHQGVFLKDRKQLLEQSSVTTKGLRKMMFHSAEEIEQNQDVIRSYISEAIQNQKNGTEIKMDRSRTLVMPSELQKVLEQAPKLKKAFEKFTPGKQREFADYIISAKQTATKERRIEKISKMIMEGIGLHDRYK